MANDLEKTISGAKILSAYIPNYDMEIKVYSIILGLAGAGLAVHGISNNNAAEAVVGMSADASLIARHTFNYVKAYFEAKLDYLQNGRFTKLDQSEISTK